MVRGCILLRAMLYGESRSFFELGLEDKKVDLVKLLIFY